GKGDQRAGRQAICVHRRCRVVEAHGHLAYAAGAVGGAATRQEESACPRIETALISTHTWAPDSSSSAVVATRVIRARTVASPMLTYTKSECASSFSILTT